MGGKRKKACGDMLLLLLLFVLTVSYSCALPSDCPRGFVPCESGQCIRQSRVCDGHQDCDDNTDEKDCAVKPCQPPDFFRCHNGHCVSMRYRCDGENECGDGSDEVDCDQAGRPKYINCTDDEFRCSDTICVPGHWRCDGKMDCLDGSDETIGCTDQSICKEHNTFLCANHHCVPNEWRCDGQDDCLDNSDEQGCTIRPPPWGRIRTDCPPDRDLLTCDDEVSCVEMAEMCDGVRQCLDGSDEGSRCNASKVECKTFGCSHRCIPTPKGPLCTCPKGFNIHNDKYCKDYDECQEYAVCSQRCINLPGTYQCDCLKGFQLQKDKRSCLVTGPEPLLVFSTKTEVRALYLKSNVYFPVAKDQLQVAGVAYDGKHVYWTSVYEGHEAIMRSNEYGTDLHVVVTSGMTMPEDLAVDWVTDNIYFTDSRENHIGVCRSDGIVCTALVNEDVDSPRAIAVLPSQGVMYWTDWGSKPMVAKAFMDGTDAIALVSQDIHWPNGLAIDTGNNRLYWADAKLKVIESVRLDGSDRRMVLEDVVKRPFGLALFEDKVYWSDFDTKEILACHKFNGKGLEKIAHSRENHIYSIHIYHPAIHPEVPNPCNHTDCSDLCLISANLTYSCACPIEKLLNEDKHTCRTIKKEQAIAIAGANTLVLMKHKVLGKQEFTTIRLGNIDVGPLAYDSINGTVFISDILNNKISVYDPASAHFKPLPISSVGRVEAMDFDYLSGNLYWADSEQEAIKVFGFYKRKFKTIYNTFGTDIPIGLALVPARGVMFVAFRHTSSTKCHLDRISMDGAGMILHVVENIKGPHIQLTYDHQMNRVFFIDSGRNTIESVNVEGGDHEGYIAFSYTPVSVTTLGSNIFWTSAEANHLHWGSKFDSSSSIKSEHLGMFTPIDKVFLVSMPGIMATHPTGCLLNNGGCTHICLNKPGGTACGCPEDMSLQPDNSTCEFPTFCSHTHFKCPSDGSCISLLLRCDGNNDCPHGEDEKNCTPPCMPHQFECHDGKCISAEYHCDGQPQCADGSDERHCEQHACDVGQFTCRSGECVSDMWVCDGHEDCDDGSDESACSHRTCPPGKFRCHSGSCIPAHWECDGEVNCEDATDEHDGCMPQFCAPDDFVCTNGRCLDHSFVCNGRDDCGDNSDEVGCEEEAESCGHDEFQCSSSAKDLFCIHVALKCDGHADCPKGDDERNCGVCSSHEFKCDGNKCIAKQWVCDGPKDCRDGTDEDPEMCSDISVEGDGHRIIPSCLEHQCFSGECVPFSVTCDGKKDCRDGSDEGGKCSTACDGDPCLDVCMATPDGALCKCRPGYEMARRSLNCTDIDECTRNICSQMCHNTPGSFFCICAEGYSLRLDRHSCKANGEPPEIVVVMNRNEIHVMPMTLQGVHLVHPDTGSPIRGLDVDTRSYTVFWSLGNSIYYKFLHRNETKLVSNLGRPTHIALDWITDNIYFVDESTYDWIRVCSFSWKRCAKIATRAKESIQEIVYPAIDPTAGYIFWAETYGGRSRTDTLIKKSSLAGLNVTVIRETSVLKGLTLDTIQNRVFWLDYSDTKLYSCNYTGGDQRTHFFREELGKPSGLTFFEDKIYWIAAQYGKLKMCAVYGNVEECRSINLEAYNSDFFTIMQRERQYTGSGNRCPQSICDNLCVSGGTAHPKCLCPDGSLTRFNVPCLNQTSDINATFPEHTGLEDTSHYMSSIPLVLLLLVLLGVLAFFGYQCYKRRRGRLISNLRVRFFNVLHGGAAYAQHVSPAREGGEDSDDEEVVASEMQALSSPEAPPGPSETYETSDLSHPSEPSSSRASTSKSMAPAPPPPLASRSPTRSPSKDVESGLKNGRGSDADTQRLILDF